MFGNRIRSNAFSRQTIVFETDLMGMRFGHLCSIISLSSLLSLEYLGGRCELHIRQAHMYRADAIFTLESTTSVQDIDRHMGKMWWHRFTQSAKSHGTSV
jgi:hypothetical protein